MSSHSFPTRRSSDLFAATGGYDEDFFRCSENLDLTLKTYREGWQILFSSELPCAELEVRGFLDSARRIQNRLNLRNKLWTVWKHFPWWRGLIWGGGRVAAAALRSIRYGWIDYFLAGARQGVFAPRRIRQKRAPLRSEVWRRLRELRRGCFVDARALLAEAERSGVSAAREDGSGRPRGAGPGARGT